MARVKIHRVLGLLLLGPYVVAPENLSRPYKYRELLLIVGV